MAKFLQILAVLCALSVLAAWFSLGANRGWTKTEVGTRVIDPVTEIPYHETRPAFVPGVDFLGAGLIGSGVLFLTGFAISKLSKKNPTS